MENYNRAKIKQTAKEAMKTASPKPILVALLLIIIAGAGAGAISGASGLIANMVMLMGGAAGVDKDSVGVVAAVVVVGVAISVLGTILSGIFSNTMRYGYVDYNLKVYRGEPAKIGTIFSGFSVLFKTIGATILTAIFQVLWLMVVVIPFMLVVGLSAYLFYLAAENSLIILGILGVVLMVAAYAALLVWCVYVSYRYWLVPYAVMDRRDLGVMGCITFARKAMKGNTIKGLGMSLSFLGWYLLEGLILAATIGLGVGVGSLLAILGASGDSDGMALVIVGVVVVVLACLVGAVLVGVLSLWVSTYVNLAVAGFYCALTQEDAPACDGYGLPGEPLPPTPPAAPQQPGEVIYRFPSGTPVPPSDSAPEAPAPVAEPPAAPKQPGEVIYRFPSGTPVPPTPGPVESAPTVDLSQSDAFFHPAPDLSTPTPPPDLPGEE